MGARIKTKIENLHLRHAEKTDIDTILGFIKELAEYENLSDQVSATADSLYHTLFINKYAEVILAEYEGKPVGFVLFFHNYSTFLGKPGIYIEDIFIQPEYRGIGIGKSMLAYVAKLTIERNCGRLEWSCLNWNEPSIQFYKQMGAKPMDEWTVYRTTDQELKDLADRF